MKQLIFILLSCLLMAGDTPHVRAQFTVRSFSGNSEHLIIEPLRPLQFKVDVTKGEFREHEQLDCKITAEPKGTITTPDGEQHSAEAWVANCHGREFIIRGIIFPQD